MARNILNTSLQIVVALSLTLGGCISEGRVSGHPFIVATNRGRGTPTPEQLYQKIDVFFRMRGFTAEEMIIPEFRSGSKVETFRYVLREHPPSNGRILATGSFMHISTAVVVSLHGSHNKPSQYLEDQIYQDFKTQFSTVYDPSAITDQLSPEKRNPKYF